jgi:3-deoxy-alpha-D-manno-octulosonate 8-oxidase
VLGIHHGIGCCIAFDYLDEIYPAGVAEFRQMMARHDISLPRGLTRDLGQAAMEKMVTTALGLVPLWENCCLDWASMLTGRRWAVSPDDEIRCS